MAEAAGPAAALRLIGDRNFGPYFVGNAASASGTWFQNLSAAILVFRLTHSAFLLGVLNFGNFVPVLVLAPWAGSAADRFDRRRLLVTTQLVAAALSGILAALAWRGLARVWVVIVFALGLGVMSAFSAPVSMALVAFLGFRPAASLLDGALAGVFGVRTAGVVLALPAFACAAAILAAPRLARWRMP